eukprot:TRINITY_DN9493_c0_g2_i4.p1 TRINITY_DN9493_c0_g2~~TRINITY_DN9493_c0_g2_i4.p1  ORF type:complete len:701 (+),score=175.64 TRINITY_DN9493_c0_g2_i4:118-2220(+)
MFTKLANAFRSATNEFTEALNSQQLSPVENLKQTWHSIAEYVVYCEQEDDLTPTDQTNLPTCFGAIVDILVEEEESHGGETGPCMEFILNHRILDQIVKMGLHNKPPGLLPLTLAFFTQIFTRIKQQILPHVAVSTPVQTLLHGTTAALRDDPDLNRVAMLLLCAVCGKLVENMYLGDLFVLNAGSLGDASLQARKPPVNLLVEAAGAVVTEPNWDESRLAKRALLVCVSLRSEACQQAMLNHSPIWNRLADHFVQLYVELPQQYGVASSEFQALLAQYSHERAPSWKSLPERLDAVEGHPELTALHVLVGWLSFMDELAGCNPGVGKVSEDQAHVTTTYLTVCLTQLRSELLVRAFVVFLLGPPQHLSLSLDAPLDLLDAAGIAQSEQPDPDVFAGDASPEPSAAAPYTAFESVASSTAATEAAVSELRQTLISRCDDMSDRLATASLLLVLRLLSSYHELAYWQLLLGDVKAESAEETGDQAESTGAGHELIDTLMDVVPAHLKTDNAEDSYTDYLVSAQAAGHLASQRCRRWITQSRDGLEPWVTAARAEDLLSADQSIHQDHTPLRYVCRNSFVGMLVRKVKRLFQQPRETNLVLTAIVTTLIQVPHAAIRQVLMSQVDDGIWSAITALQEDLALRAGKDKELEARVRSTRADMINGRPVDDTRTGRLAQGVIYLEEFCKELAASLLVNANQVALS